MDLSSFLNRSTQAYLWWTKDHQLRPELHLLGLALLLHQLSFDPSSVATVKFDYTYKGVQRVGKFSSGGANYVSKVDMWVGELSAEKTVHHTVVASDFQVSNQHLYGVKV